MTKAVKTVADGTYCGVYSDKTAGSASKKVANPKVAFSGSPAADKKQAVADEKFFTKEPKATPVRFRYGRV
jgi:hypothetical protein